MSFGRRLFLYCLSGVIAWLVSTIGFIFCFSIYQIIGKYIYLLFFGLTYWPWLLISTCISKPYPNWFEEVAWPIECVINLIGWILLGALIAALVHSISAKQKAN
jgi:hypothetical protein